MSEKRFATPENEQLSYEAVFSDMSNKRQELQAQLAEIESRPGFKLDAIEMMEKRREERRLKQELAAHESEWNSYGGEAVDRAQAQVGELSFKSDASERVSAQLALRDAKNDFYQNYLDAHPVNERDVDTANTSTSTNEVAAEGDAVTDPDAPASEAVIESSDAESEQPTDGPQITNPEEAASDAVSDDEIEVSPIDAPAHEAVVETDVVTDIDTPASDAVVERSVSPELEAKLAELEEARATWATISTQRQSRTFDRRIKGYNATKERYDMLVQELGRIQLHDQIEAAGSKTEKNAVVIGYLAEEQNKLRELVRHETDAKFINKFSNWMNKGSRKARIAKGLVLGLAVGTGGSLLLGAAGAAGAAGLAVGASRFVRGYTMRHTAGMDQLDDRQVSTAQARANTYADDSDRFEYTTQVFRDYFETDSKREQGKRRKAFAWGAGSVAVGAVAGHLMHIGIDQLRGHSGASSVVDHTPNHDHTSGGGHHDGGTHNGHESHPGQGHNLLNAKGVYNVHPGEGWDETLKDMGVPQDKWADVLKDAGPKLHQQGWAYFDNAHHEWRITKPGHLSLGAVKALEDASARHGFSFR